MNLGWKSLVDLGNYRIGTAKAARRPIPFFIGQPHRTCLINELVLATLHTKLISHQVKGSRFGTEATAELVQAQQAAPLLAAQLSW